MATPTKSEVSFIDNPHAPELFADGAAGCFIHNGVLRITLFSSRVNHATAPGPVNNVVLARIAMPSQMAEAMAKSVLELLKIIKDAPAQPPQTTPTLQ